MTCKSQFQCGRFNKASDTTIRHTSKKSVYYPKFTPDSRVGTQRLINIVLFQLQHHSQFDDEMARN